MKRGHTIVIALLFASAGAAYFAMRNVAPEPADDKASTQEMRPVKIDVLFNDRDRNGDPIRIVSVATPANGTATIVDDGRAVIYTPRAGFVGADEFDYTVSDPGGLTGTAKVAIDVAFTPPDFHRRSRSANLPEMMQEPPSSVYGSTINVFFFRDKQQRLREITISGHADALTCASTSGAFADALLSSGSNSDDFLLAGAGRMAIPALAPERLQALESDSKVREYKRLATKLSIVRLMWQNKQMTDADATEFLGSSMQEAEANLAALTAEATVKDYVASARPSESAAAFERQAAELQQTSGMLRIHEVQYGLVDAVRARLVAAAKTGGATVVKFDDLLGPTDGEAVVYTPMLHAGSAEPVEIAVPVGEFSPEGFRRTAKLYRSALENAVVGSAERRLEYAKRQLERNEQSQANCRALSQSQLDEVVGIESCDRDGACKTGRRVTQREFCTVSVPQNFAVARGWRDDAQRLIDRIKTMSERQDVNRLDSLNYAAVIDSMLRNWALSFSQAQPAFDEWRMNGRQRAWRTITMAAEKAGIGRAAMSGESLVFNVRLDGEIIRLKPMLIIDLRRTTVVLDPALAVTAAVYPWELRSIEAGTAPRPDGPQTAIEQLVSDPVRLAQRLEADPHGEMSKLIEQLLAEMPAETDGLRIQAVEARSAWSREVEKYLAQEFDATPLPNASMPDVENKAFDRLIAMREQIYAARNMADVSPAFRMRMAFVAAQLYALSRGAPVPQSWQALMDQTRVPSERVMEAAGPKAGERMLFGEPLSAYIASVIGRARTQDASLVKRLLEGQPVETTAAVEDAKPSVQTTMTAVVGGVERARSVLELRRRIEQALAVFREDGTASVSTLSRIVEAPLNDASIAYHGRMWSEVQQYLNYLSIQASGELGPIEGQKLISVLHESLTRLDAELRRLKPLLSAARVSREQDAIVARLLFDEGLYQEALDRLAPRRSSLSLFAPGLSWTVLTPNLKAMPQQIEFARSANSLVARATIASQQIDVVRFDGLSEEDAEALTKAIPEPMQEWNEGDPLWEQIMLSTVPARPRVIGVARALHDDRVHLPALKAMVYACAAPGAHVLAAGGRCQQAAGSTELYDRIQPSQGARFVWPPVAGFAELARKRFKREMAWRFVDNGFR